MSLEREISERSESACELCSADGPLTVYAVLPVRSESVDDHAHLCNTCIRQIENPAEIEANHWRCLNTSMWSQVPAVQVITWRMLQQLQSEAWTQELLDTLYLDEETLEWAKATEDTIPAHVDANGAPLSTGDTVVLIQDLKVKGASFVAKRGTAVRRITLVADNSEHIEGKIEGQRIVILTKYVKKK